MKRPKMNPELSEALSQLRDWAVIERTLTDDRGAHKAWRDVEEWAAGTALKYRVELAHPVSPSNIQADRPSAGSSDSSEIQKSTPCTQQSDHPPRTA